MAAGVDNELRAMAQFEIDSLKPWNRLYKIADAFRTFPRRAISRVPLEVFQKKR
jgi:hypothetical protein